MAQNLIRKAIAIILCTSLFGVIALTMTGCKNDENTDDRHEKDCIHTYIVTAFDSVNHEEICELCGDLQTSNHTWGNYAFEENTYNHYATCSVCGQKSAQRHSWYYSGTLDFFGLEIRLAKCDGCGQEGAESVLQFTYDGSASSCSSHHWGVLSYGNDQHTLECHSCGATETAAHSWNEGVENIEDSCVIYTCTGGCVRIEPVEINWEDAEYPIETYYTMKGSHSFKTAAYSVSGKDYTEHKFWYPADLETSNEKYPVIVFCNGTGSTYAEGDTRGNIALFEHIASWGYILVANNDGSSGNGDSASESLDKLLSENSNSSSVFYGKVDVDKIVVAGHSQGGTGAKNLASEGKYSNSHLIKAVYAASAPSEALAESWLQNTPYDAALVKVPTFLTSSTGQADHSTSSTDGICRLDGSLRENVDDIVANHVTVVMARRNGDGVDHGQMLYMGKGYMLAWFDYILNGSEFAAQAFFGDDPEILRNTNWQDEEIHVHNEVVDDAKAPTCGETGLTEGAHCSCGNKVWTAQEVIPATGEHIYDDETGECSCGAEDPTAS